LDPLVDLQPVGVFGDLDVFIALVPFVETDLAPFVIAANLAPFVAANLAPFVAVGQSDLSNPVPQELHSRERSSARTDIATSTSSLVE